METTQSLTKSSRAYVRSRGYDRLTYVHNGKSTTVSLEQIFVDCLDDMSRRAGLSRSKMIGHIIGERDHCNRARALRVAVVADLLEQLSEFKKLDNVE